MPALRSEDQGRVTGLPLFLCRFIVHDQAAGACINIGSGFDPSPASREVTGGYRTMLGRQTDLSSHIGLFVFHDGGESGGCSTRKERRKLVWMDDVLRTEFC